MSRFGKTLLSSRMLRSRQVVWLWRACASVAHSRPAQELKEAYFAEANAASTSAAKPEEKKVEPSADTKKKPFPKKIQEDDPFASEGEADAEEAERKQMVQTKKRSVKRAQSSDLDADADDSDRPQSKKKKSARWFLHFFRTMFLLLVISCWVNLCALLAILSSNLSSLSAPLWNYQFLKSTCIGSRG